MRLQHSERGRSARRCLARVGAALALVVSFVPAGAADASDSDLTSEQVAAEMLRVQAKADETAERWAEAQGRAQDLLVEIQAAETNLSETSARYEQLEADMAQIAVDRFTGRSGETILVLGGNSSEAMQRDALRSFALNVSASDLDTVDALRGDLENEQANLDALNSENDQLIDALTSSEAEIEAQLIELAQLREHLKDEEAKREYEARLAEQRQEAARVAAERDAKAAAQQGSAAPPAPARGSGAQTVTPTGPGPAVPMTPTSPIAPAPPPAPVTPVQPGGSWLCPIAGPNAFGDTWGAPRSGGRKHQGVDMMSPFGTPLVAVVAGNVTMKTNTLGGNVIFLKGVDGNMYYYAHLSSWEGGSRSVKIGEVIGYVGATGNTSANHLHFQIHPGGGAPVNPYPTVRQHC